MILAAGFGTRLFPLTIDRTKPAIPFLGKPLVGYVAEYVAKFGFKDIVVNLHHQPESVREVLGDGAEYGVNIHYTEEIPDILGTAGALDNARHLLEDETFVIVNGKIITDIDISEAIETHKKTGAIATMVLKPNIKREKFTEVHTKDGFLTDFGDFAHPFTADEIKDVQKLDLWLDVNGARQQTGNTTTMIFGVKHLVSYVSRFMKLEPGDVITTGTPPGVALGRKPPNYLRAGDTLSCGIEGLGSQASRVVAWKKEV